MADDILQGGAQQVIVAYQTCNGNTLDLGDNGLLVSLSFPDKTINAKTVEYRQNRRGDFVPRSETPQAPSVGQVAVNMTRRASKLQRVFERPENTTWYSIVREKCADPKSFKYVKIAPDTSPATISGGEVANPNAPANITGTINYDAAAGYYSVAPGQVGGSLTPGGVTQAGTGVVLPESAGNCGSSSSCSDGTDTWYQAHAAAGGAKPTLVYSIAGVVSSVSIAGATNDDQPVGRAILVPGYIVIPFNGAASARGYLYAPLSAQGVPGSFVRVTFAAPAALTGAVADGSSITFAVNGASQWRASAAGVAPVAITQPTVQPMQCIVSRDGIVARGGDNMTLHVGKDSETSTAQIAFTLPVGSTAVPGGTSITGVWIHGDGIYEIGTSIGRLFRTSNAGTTWIELTAGDGTNPIRELQYTLDGQVGRFRQDQKIYTTITRGFLGGNAPINGWSADKWSTNVPTGTAIAGLTVPLGVDRWTQANYAFITIGAATYRLAPDVVFA